MISKTVVVWTQCLLLVCLWDQSAEGCNGLFHSNIWTWGIGWGTLSLLRQKSVSLWVCLTERDTRLLQSKGYLKIKSWVESSLWHRVASSINYPEKTIYIGVQRQNLLKLNTKWCVEYWTQKQGSLQPMLERPPTSTHHRVCTSYIHENEP